MKFQLKEVIDAVKNLVTADSESVLTHCQDLDVKAKALGFESYHHMRETLKRIPPDQFGNTSLRLMRKVCAARRPSLRCAYFEFHTLPGDGLGFYSHWIGWDRNGDEVRAPRPMDGLESVSRLRQCSGVPVYVVESPKELIAWQDVWGSTALIPQNLAKQSFPWAFDKSHLAEKDPPMDKVKQKAQQYIDNMIKMLAKKKRA